MTLAPFSQIHSEGVRFRMASGYGGYSYAGLRGSETYNRVLDGLNNGPILGASRLKRDLPMPSRVISGGSTR